MNNPSAYLKDKCKIAEGVSPVQGIDGYIQVLVGQEDNNEQRPLEAEDGKVDYKELIRLDNVRSGQIIAKRIDPVEGVPGKAVTGEEIPFRPGKARFKVGKTLLSVQMELQCTLQLMAW